MEEELGELAYLGKEEGDSQPNSLQSYYRALALGKAWGSFLLSDPYSHT